MCGFTDRRNVSEDLRMSERDSVHEQHGPAESSAPNHATHIHDHQVAPQRVPDVLAIKPARIPGALWRRAPVMNGH